jgi:hypothetical protein
MHFKKELYFLYLKKVKMKYKYEIENFDNFLTKYPIILEIYSKDEVTGLYKDWRINNGVFFHDFLWLLFNKAILKNGDFYKENGNESLFHKNAFFLYNCMAHFRREEGASKEEINKFHRLSHKIQIDEAKNEERRTYLEMALIPHPKCEYANSLDKTRYSIDNFFDECKIASKLCTLKNGCGCSITIVPMRDNKGRIIRDIDLSTKKTDGLKKQKGCFFYLLFFSFTIIIYSILFY